MHALRGRNSAQSRPGREKDATYCSDTRHDVPVELSAGLTVEGFSRHFGVARMRVAERA